jgi:transcriptional regulator GlxA family with amidase domain
LAALDEPESGDERAAKELQQPAGAGFEIAFLISAGGAIVAALAVLFIPAAIARPPPTCGCLRPPAPDRRPLGGLCSGVLALRAG